MAKSDGRLVLGPNEKGLALASPFRASVSSLRGARGGCKGNRGGGWYGSTGGYRAQIAELGVRVRAPEHRMRRSWCFGLGGGERVRLFWGCFAGHEVVGHDEEVAEDFGGEVVEADEDGV